MDASYRSVLAWMLATLGVGVFLGLHVEVEGDDLPIVVELVGHWSSEGLSKL